MVPIPLAGFPLAGAIVNDRLDVAASVMTANTVEPDPLMSASSKTSVAGAVRSVVRVSANGSKRGTTTRSNALVAMADRVLQLSNVARSYSRDG